jgi:methylenetetrahydrofolate reductase (NADPH)
MSRIADLLARGRTFSFEFFPPKTPEAMEQLRATIRDLEPLHPSFVSVTYGAMGSTRTLTRDLVVSLRATTAIPPMAHLTCVGHTRSDVDDLVNDYTAAGVENILALGGDAPEDGSTLPSEFRYALDLVEHLRAGHDVCIGVAAHPEGHPRSASLDADRRHLAEKLRMADFAVTQFFFDAAHWRRLVDDMAALGVYKPIIPGIMPVTNVGQLERMAKMSGADIPAWLVERLQAVSTPADVRRVGVEVATELAARLLADGAPGVHLYTLNRSTATREIYAALGLGGNAATAQGRA